MATETVPPGDEIRCEPESLLRGLFKRSADRLTDDELSTVAESSVEAENIVGHIATLCEGIGCLVAADGDRQRGASAGNFQRAEDVATLLWALGGMASYAKGMMNVAGWAEAAIERRARDAHPAEIARRGRRASGAA
mgnify:CR=1 FL=1|jgi:hypothetical protein